MASFETKLNANPGMLAGQILDGWNVGNKPLECLDYKSLSFIFPDGQESTTLPTDGSYCKYATLKLIFCSKQLRLREREASPHLDPPTTLCHPSPCPFGHFGGSAHHCNAATLEHLQHLHGGRSNLLWSPISLFSHIFVGGSVVGSNLRGGLSVPLWSSAEASSCCQNICFGVDRSSDHANIQPPPHTHTVNVLRALIG